MYQNCWSKRRLQTARTIERDDQKLARDDNLNAQTHPARHIPTYIYIYRRIHAQKSSWSTRGDSGGKEECEGKKAQRFLGALYIIIIACNLYIIIIYVHLPIYTIATYASVVNKLSQPQMYCTVSGHDTQFNDVKHIYNIYCIRTI
jgi:hypothetical protein